MGGGSPCLRSGISWGEWKSGGRDMQERPGQMQRLYLLLAPISALFLPHTKEIRGSRPTPLPSHRQLAGYSGCGQRTFLARKSPNPARMPGRTASLLSPFPLLGFEDNFHEERLAAFGGCLGFECVLISFFGVCIFPHQTETKFPPL